MRKHQGHTGSSSVIRRPSERSLFQHSLVVILPLAILTAVALGFGFKFAGDNSAARVRMIEASLAVIGGAGAALALVVNYRRQQVLEDQDERSYREAHTKQFSDFTEQLADARGPVKLAGAYSLLRLADEWNEQRQQVIQVLCAYLRLPWQQESEDHTLTVEREVRNTILREMVSRMQLGGSFTESSYDYDFSGATFKDFISFRGAIFTGNVNFVLW